MYTYTYFLYFFLFYQSILYIFILHTTNCVLFYFLPRNLLETVLL
jgi:hypothetical protein